MKQRSNLYDGEYFEVVENSSNGKSVIVQCNTCKKENNSKLNIRKCMSSNGNVFKHVDKYHPGLLSKIKAEKHVRSINAFDTSSKEVKIKKIKKEIANYTDSDDSDDDESDVSSINSKSNANYIQIKKSSSSINENDMKMHEVESAYIEADPFVEMNNFETNGPTNNNRQTTSSTTQNHIDDNNYGHSSNHFVGSTTMQNREIVTLRKQLMQKEFMELQQMRQQKHKFEMEILRAELEMKKVEHRKRVQWYDLQVKQLSS